jgi:hypothetical protein
VHEPLSSDEPRKEPYPRAQQGAQMALITWSTDRSHHMFVQLCTNAMPFITMKLSAIRCDCSKTSTRLYG